MADKVFAAILGQLGVMSGEQRATLLRVLSAPEAQATVEDPLDGGGLGQPRCGHFRSSHVARWGSAHGLARHRCRDCRRTFNVLTGSALARLRHRPQWLSFAAALPASSRLTRPSSAAPTTACAAGPSPARGRAATPQIPPARRAHWPARHLG